MSLYYNECDHCRAELRGHSMSNHHGHWCNSEHFHAWWKANREGTPWSTYSELEWQFLRLQREEARLDEALDQAMEERDSYHEMADKLAAAIAEHLGVEIGEHSSMNCPWDNALEHIKNAEARKAGARA